MIQNQNIAVIGAGLAGVTIARALAQNNNITVFEKSRGIGGRMPTRRVSVENDTFHFDHGAQFFTAKSEPFKQLCAQMLEQDVIEEWKCKFAEIADGKMLFCRNFNETVSHFVSTPYMNSMCKHLAKGLNVLLQTKVLKMQHNNKTWTIEVEGGQTHTNFNYVIVAVPSHQAVGLVPQQSSCLEYLKNLKMQGCFTLMVVLEKPVEVKFDAALVKSSNNTNILSWVSLNHSKPMRNKNTAIVVHSSNLWAEQNIERNPEEVQNIMLEELHKIVSFKNEWIKHKGLHRWRYANAQKRSGKKALFEQNLKLGICGDYFISGRVESAFLSAQHLLQTMNCTENNIAACV